MENTLLMPKATAVWLIDNTSLTFEQIAGFCKMHPLEIKAIADGEAAISVRGVDPVMSGQLSREELDKATADPEHELRLSPPKIIVPKQKKRGARYTPLAKRQDRPNAILWLLRNHPELSVAQIVRLIGTTKPTILAIRERTHWNSSDLVPADPVVLGLCTQIDLDHEVQAAQTHAAKTQNRQEKTSLTPETMSEAEKNQEAKALLDDEETKANTIFK